MSLLGRVFAQINPFDHGATYSHPAQPQAKPQPRVNVQQLTNALQVHAANNPVLQAPHPMPAPPPLPVHVATPQILHMANQTFNQSPTVRTQTPARNAFLEQQQHPSVVQQVQQKLGQKLQLPIETAQILRQELLPTPHEIGQTYQSSLHGQHPGLAPLAAGVQASTYLPLVGKVAEGIGTGVKAVGKELPSVAKAVQGLKPLDQAGKLRLPFGPKQNLHYSSGNGITTISGKANAVRAQLKQLNEVGGINNQPTHTVFYNGKAVDMGYAGTPKEQFKFGAQRIADNLGTGGHTSDTGYVKTPDGKYFEVSRSNSSAKPVSADFAQAKIAEQSKPRITPLNEIGGVGRDVEANSPAEYPKTPLTPTTSKINGVKAGQGSGPNLNKGAFSKADQAKMTKELAAQPTPANVQSADILNTTPGRVATNLNKGLSPEDNALVNKGLIHLPPTTPDIPKLADYREGGLLPVNQLNGAVKALGSKLTVLRKINTASSHALADQIVKTEGDKQALRAGYMYHMPTIQKMGNKDFQQAWDIQEGKLKPSEASPVARQGAKELKTVMKQAIQHGQEQALPVGERRNYMPHNYPQSFWKEKGSQYDSAIQHLMNTNQLNHQEAIQLFRDEAKANARRPNWFGNFENARMTNLPGYSKDKATLYNYLDNVSKRVAESRHFGIDNGIANRLLTNIRLEGGDVQAAQKAAGNYLHNAKSDGTGAKTLEKARGVFGFARLGKAFISHAGQTSNTAVDTGVARTLHGWGQFLRHNPDHADFVAKTGVINPQELHAYQNQYTSVKGLMSKGTAPLLNQVMKVNRSVTALTYRNYARFLAKKGNTAELQKLGVTGDIGKTLTPEQEVQAARGGVTRTMFGASRAKTPISAETPIGKTIGQYRTAYGYRQTGFVYDRVLKEAAKGNLMPLTRFLAVSAPVAGGTIAIKNQISGNKEGIGGIAMDTAGALGGIPGEVGLQLARYGKRDLPKALAGVAAPMAGEAVDLAERTQKALNGKPQQLEKYGLGLVPFAGSRISKAVFPPKQTNASKTAQAKATGQLPPGTTLSAKGNVSKMTQRELKATNPDELARFQGMTAKARKNVQLNNPDKFIKDQNLKIQQELQQGKKVDAFKDAKGVAQAQIYKNFDKNTIQAYGLKSTDFKAYVNQASPDEVNQLRGLDKQLVDKGLVAKSKFKGGGGGSSGGRTAKVASLKVKLPPKPKAVKAGKMPKVSLSTKKAKFKAPKLGVAKGRRIKVKYG